jgi:large subunit ribosomal protein L10
MARADKVAAVAELAQRFQSSNGAMLTDYRGLTVAQIAALRRSLGDHATFTVVKNTLTKIAAKDAGLEEQISSLLTGPSAIAFVEGDVVEAAKGLRDFARTNPHLVIKGGVLDGAALSAAEIARLADLEPRDVLLAKLAGAMKASMAGAAATFNALPIQLAQLAEALRVKRESEAAAADGGARAEAGMADEAAPAEAPAADGGAPAEAAAADGGAPAEAGMADEAAPAEASAADGGAPAEAAAADGAAPAGAESSEE